MQGIIKMTRYALPIHSLADAPRIKLTQYCASSVRDATFTARAAHCCTRGGRAHMTERTMPTGTVHEVAVRAFNTNVRLCACCEVSADWADW